MIRTTLFTKQLVDSTRKGFGRGLIKAGEVDEDIWAITADLGGSTSINAFKDKFPERFVQVGVAEQNLATVASGIASMNKLVFATSFAAFNPGRNWEQIRTTICYNDQPVIIVGTHTGLGVGEDGATHQALEDIGLMRILPNMQVVVPCDAIQAEKATKELAKQRSPAYLRLTRQNSPLITMASTKFKIGDAQVFQEGKDIVIFSAGPVIYEGLKAANELKKKGLSAAVINVHTIKPLDEKTIIKYAKKCECFITLEDHQVQGGLGSAISECLAKNNPTKGKFIGIQNSFGESGNSDELYWKYGLTSDRIITTAMKLIQEKRKTKTKTNKNMQKTNKRVQTKAKERKIKQNKTNKTTANTKKADKKTKKTIKKIVKKKITKQTKKKKN